MEWSDVVLKEYAKYVLHWNRNKHYNIPPLMTPNQYWEERKIRMKQFYRDNGHTTMVKGILCIACKKELPEMTIKEHLDGRGCPCRAADTEEPTTPC